MSFMFNISQPLQWLLPILNKQVLESIWDEAELNAIYERNRQQVTLWKQANRFVYDATVFLQLEMMWQQYEQMVAERRVAIRNMMMTTNAQQNNMMFMHLTAANQCNMVPLVSSQGHAPPLPPPLPTMPQNEPPPPPPMDLPPPLPQTQAPTGALNSSQQFETSNGPNGTPNLLTPSVGQSLNPNIPSSISFTNSFINQHAPAPPIPPTQPNSQRGQSQAVKDKNAPQTQRQLMPWELARNVNNNNNNISNKNTQSLAEPEDYGEVFNKDLMGQQQAQSDNNMRKPKISQCQQQFQNCNNNNNNNAFMREALQNDQLTQGAQFSQQLNQYGDVAFQMNNNMFGNPQFNQNFPNPFTNQFIPPSVSTSGVVPATQPTFDHRVSNAFPVSGSGSRQRPSRWADNDNNDDEARLRQQLRALVERGSLGHDRKGNNNVPSIFDINVPQPNEFDPNNRPGCENGFGGAGGTHDVTMNYDAFMDSMAENAAGNDVPESAIRRRNYRQRKHSASPDLKTRSTKCGDVVSRDSRDRERDTERDRERDRDRERERVRDRDRERNRDREGDRNRGRERDRGDRDRERDRNKERSRDKDSDRDRGISRRRSGSPSSRRRSPSPRAVTIGSRRLSRSPVPSRRTRSPSRRSRSPSHRRRSRSPIGSWKSNRSPNRDGERRRRSVSPQHAASRTDQQEGSESDGPQTLAELFAIPPPPPPFTSDGFKADAFRRTERDNRESSSNVSRNRSPSLSSGRMDVDMRSKLFGRNSDSPVVISSSNALPTSASLPHMFDRGPLQQPISMPLIPVQTVSIDDILNEPGRSCRPAKIVIILRGAPGAGKSYIAKLIKDREIAKGGIAPRVLCLDDYFTVDNEKMVNDPKTGRSKLTKVFEYEYDAALEPSYRKQALKTYKKTIEDGFFNFIIVDAVNGVLQHFDEMWSVGKHHGYQVYIVELEVDLMTCVNRNIHQRTKQDITNILNRWEKSPPHFTRLDCTPLLQDASIQEVDMEDDGGNDKGSPVTIEDTTAPGSAEGSTEPDSEGQLKKSDPKPEGLVSFYGPDSDNSDKEDAATDNSFEKFTRVVSASKWDLVDTEAKLDKLDGMKLKKHISMANFLDVTEDYNTRSATGSDTAGKKRVRWADIEERTKMEREQAIGFVIGGTNWTKLTGNYNPDHALERTKYFLKDQQS